MWTNNLKTSFVWCPETEAKRVVYTTFSVVRGFYKRKGFAVLPEVMKPGNPAEVVLPPLNYGKIDNYWRRAAGKKDGFPIMLDKELLKEVEILLRPTVEVDKKVMKAWEDRWRQAERGYWWFVEQLLPDDVKKLGQLEIRLTRYGTIASHGHLELDQAGQRLMIFIRIDGCVGNIAEIILTALMRYKQKRQEYRWLELEAIVDFLMSRPQLKALFPDYQGTLASLTGEGVRWRKKSVKYLRQLGVEYAGGDLEFFGGRVRLEGKVIEPDLTDQERVLLHLLMKHEGQLVSFDEVADALWGVGEFKSLYALNKAIQRLRMKLVKLGLPESALKTIRKSGYVLGKTVER